MASFNTVMPFGAWASGNLMIASHGTILPPYCVKCGRPADLNSFSKKLSWHPQWIYRFVLLALLLYVTIALAMSKRMSFLFARGTWKNTNRCASRRQFFCSAVFRK